MSLPLLRGMALGLASAAARAPTTPTPSLAPSLTFRGLAAAAAVLPQSTRRRRSSSYRPRSGQPLLQRPFTTTAASDDDGGNEKSVQPPRQSRFLGVSFNSAGKGRWYAHLSVGGKRVFSKYFPLDKEKEAALAVDAAIREHLGPDYLTNFHAETGAFMDPRQALSTAVTAANGGRGGTSLVSELGNTYKAVARLQKRPVLVGLYASAAEAEQALVDWAEEHGPSSNAGSGGIGVSPKQSRFLGLSWDTRHRKWKAQLSFEGKRVLCQFFSEELEEEAARVYDAHVRKYHGPDGMTNFDADGRFLDPKARASRLSLLEPDGTLVAGVDYRGVTFHRNARKWQAQIIVGGTQYNLGHFTDAKDAALCYDAAARKYHGSRARCNFDERSNRTDVRVRINNSPTARARYTLLQKEGQGPKQKLERT